MDVGAVNETLVEMNAEPVIDTGRHIRTDVGGAQGASRHTVRNSLRDTDPG